MTTTQKEVQQANLEAEKKVIQELKKVYNQASQDCASKIAELDSRTDTQNLSSIIYQKQYQQMLKSQIDSVLDTLQNNEFDSIATYLTESYQNGYTGAMYDLQKQGIPMTVPLDESQVVKAIQTDSKISNDMYSRLGEDVSTLKKSIKSELSRGVANGSSWAEIADKITTGFNSPYKVAYNNAIRIARTEGHRIQQESQLDALQEASDAGADIVKQWDATLDGRTRPEHREADGQIVELDEYFTVGGEKLKAPGVGGSARNVCNCRCCMLQRARWALDDEELQTLQARASYFGLDKTQSFEEYKQKYLQIKTDDDIMALSKIISVADCSDYAELSQYLSNTYGISCNTSVENLEYSVVQKALAGCESIIQEYPELANSLQNIQISSRGVMSCDGTSITLNPKYFLDTTTLEQACQSSSNSGWWVKNSSVESTGAHECGHAVEQLLINANPTYTYDFQRMMAWNDCTEAKLVVSEAVKNVKKTAYGKGKTKADLINGISQYATKTASETMAEAFADVYANGSNANPLSIEIKAVTQNRLKQYQSQGGSTP